MSNLGRQRVIKGQPLDAKLAKKLSYDYCPKDFVTATTSQDDFYAGNVVRDGTSDDEGPALSEGEKNKLAAKIIKAEMIGNFELAEKLKSQLNGCNKSTPSLNSEEVPCNDVLLTKTDHRTGLTMPIKSKHHEDPSNSKRKKPKVDMDRDSELSVKELYEQEKFTSAEEQLALFGATSSKIATSQKVDESWTVDDVMMSKSENNAADKIAAKNRSHAIAAHRKHEQTLASCLFCIDSPKLMKHLVVAMGLKTYLMIPQTQPMVEGHCFIVPMSHVSSCVQMDEDVFDEMKIWRKGLVAMFKDRKKDVVFFETAKNIRQQPHCFVECIPVPVKIGDMAPIYFKKAIMECEEEWAQNKKLISLQEKDIRRALPKGFSYFSVDFGLQSGYAHVIENEDHFSGTFGKEIVAGMMDLDQNLWRKPVKENFDDQVKRAGKFRTLWRPFDWTERVKAALKNE